MSFFMDSIICILLLSLKNYVSIICDYDDYYRDTRDMKTLAVLLAVLLLALSNSQLVPSCLNHEGKTVDWWLVYYAPKSIRDKKDSFGYMYMDSFSNQSTFSKHFGVGDG